MRWKLCCRVASRNPVYSLSRCAVAYNRGFVTCAPRIRCKVKHEGRGRGYLISKAESIHKRNAVWYLFAAPKTPPRMPKHDSRRQP
jgi:hypothetical protein